MSKLSAFLNPVQRDEEEIVISNRFVERDDHGEPMRYPDGNPIPAKFRIRPISQEENERLIRQATRRRKTANGMVEELDKTAYTRALVIAGTVFPDFRSSELCEAYGVLDPSLVPSKMLYVGEYQKLADGIAEISGLSADDQIEDEAKN